MENQLHSMAHCNLNSSLSKLHKLIIKRYHGNFYLYSWSIVPQWNPIVILPTLVIATTFGADCDDNFFVKIIFLCQYTKHWTSFLTRKAWWRHQMEIFPRYWPFVRGIHRWPVNSPYKGQWRGALTFFFDLRLNKRLCKQSRRHWFETPSHPLLRHCNGMLYPWNQILQLPITLEM